MIQVNTYPPNIEQIRKHLAVDRKGIIYTYGKVIYNPDNGYLDQALLFHEATHSLQQDKLGPEKWWDKYLEDKDFRLSQEVEAYKNQYNKYCKTVKDRNERARFLHQIAFDLSSEQYGNIATLMEAKKLIEHGNKAISK